MTTHQQAVEWLLNRTAELLSAPAGTLSPDTPFSQLGLSSMQAVELAGDLERWSGRSLSPTIAYDYPTIEAVAAHLTSSEERQQPVRPSAPSGEPVAIVGIGCRLPGADGPERFWSALLEGVDAITEVPGDRWDGAALYDPDPDRPGRMNTRWGGFLGDVEGFDADFFAISAREAARMDPQQRLLLEVAWEALEDAGVPAASLSGTRAGVFVGASTYDHGATLLSSGAEAEAYDGTGAALSVIANRLSYVLNLRGPSMVVDSACSSSLVAVHLACQALRAGEADLALAGGVNVITSPRIALSFSKGRLMAPDGRCKPFDHRANGYVRSEGAGVVLLRPLSAALAAGDRIYAVIHGSAVNQDGRTNGLAAPNRPAQEAVLRSAYAAAGVDPATVDYVEAHGTGTAVGDPIEVAALATVLGPGRPASRPLRIGSAKSNVGHLEAAAGVAGLIKAALALHHGELPPTVHFTKPNPLLGLDRLPVVVQDHAGPWPSDRATAQDRAGTGSPGGATAQDRPETGSPRAATAGVSSFGFGGTNAHVVLSSAPPPRQPEQDRTASGELYLFPVSARSRTALRRRAAALAGLARDRPGDLTWLSAAAGAAALRGDHDRYRAAVVVSSPEELAAAMTAVAENRDETSVRTRRAQRPTLVFPGQGAQWEGMGRQLADAVPAFRAAIRRCDAAIGRWLGERLWDDERGLTPRGTAHVQPALFAYQVALAETWRAWGVEPGAVIGHSMGEIAAAHVAGALSLEDAARVVCERSRLLTRLTGQGGLALVELDAEEVEPALAGRRDRLSVAAVNGPRATVLSGDPAALDEVIAELEARGVFARRVAVDFAAHSPQVEPLQEELFTALNGLSPQPATTPLYSTVTAEPAAGPELGPAYWKRNVREPVLFSPALEQLIAAGHEVFVEVAPHPVLTRSIAELSVHLGRPVTIISSVRRDEHEARALLSALGSLYATGADIAWDALYAGAVHVPLPPHGWDRQRFPLLRATPGAAVPPASGGALLGSRIKVGAEPALRLWPLLPGGAPELADHVADGVPLVPGAYWLAAAAQAAGPASGAAQGAGPGPGAAQSAGSGSVVLEDVTFEHPCPADGEAGLQLAMVPSGPGRRSFVITSDRGGGPVVHARGTVVEDAVHPSLVAPRDLPGGVPVAELYERLAAAGLAYGPRFRGLTELRTGDREAVGTFRLPDGLDSGLSPLHPALLDACFHTVAAAAGGALSSGVLPLPAGAGRVWSRGGEAVSRGRAHAVIRELGTRELVADVTVTSEAGEPVWAVSGLRIRLIRRRPAEDGRLYTLRWQPLTAGPAVTGRGGWLVLTEPESPASVGARLAERLAAAGEPYLLATGDRPLDDLLEQAETRYGGLRGVLDTRATSANDLPGTPPDRAELRDVPDNRAELRDVADDRAEGAGALPEHAVGALSEHAAAALGRHAAGTLRLVRDLILRTWRGQPPRLWLLTANPAGSVVWGLGRVIANEHPELAAAVADLPGSPTRADLDALVAALRAQDTPGQLRVRDGGLLEPKLVPAPAESELPSVPDGRMDGMPEGRMNGVPEGRMNGVPEGRMDGGLTGTPEGRADGGLTVGSVPVRADRPYLITGGLGALGLHVARWLVGKGARRLVLAGRTSPGPRARAALDELRAAGAEVRVEQVDLADAEQLAGALPADLAGVFHLAGVLEDALITTIDDDLLHRALAGKAAGAWNLHTLTTSLPVEHFVLFSSLAGLFGSPGQGAYAAANTFLDALAEHRADLGLPAQSIDWGTWSGTGLAVEAGGVDRLAARGLPPLSPEVALDLLEEALGSGRRHLVAAAFDWAAFGRAGLGPDLARMLAGQVSADRPATGAERGAVRTAALAATGAAGRLDVLRRFLLEQVGGVLGRGPESVDTSVPLQELGFDSLMAMELRTRLETGLDLRLSATVVYTFPTVEALADGLAQRLGDPQPAQTREEPDVPADLSGLDDEELAALLTEELDLKGGTA
ncbi:beta-ketoacyl synthase N-terminal-like domain-containing protein [Nonomuraea insulae]|uniref:Beta-ketoacyl synthase N-terminal-like domain-containing protein n=1 Tax=Nonomuraea insulae TaxID=1616787 RepID=A0ABW1CXB5_9ACTN